MLTHIHIRDFTIIDEVELETGSGLTVLTGETGAGKSILVDALLLAAGGRAGAEVVRHGAERAEVAATFDVQNSQAALAWLAEQAIDHDGECVLRRVIGLDGRSRAYVNGQTMPAQALRQLGEMLVDVHGQMEHQSLVKRTAQRELLDESGGHGALLAEAAQAWKTWSALRDEYDRAASAANDREARLELLRYHLGELQALDLKSGEHEELSLERRRLSQRGRLADGARAIATLLREGEDFNAEDALSRALSVARALQELDPQYAPIAGLIDESVIALREALDALERYESALDADPRRQEWVEQRLAEVESIARKHRVEPAALPQLRADLEAERSALETLDASLEGLQKRAAEAERRFGALCAQLTEARRAAAETLAQRITALMQTLGMPGGVFRIDVRPLASGAAAHGADEIEFLVSANPGQPVKPLAKVASGGELSRISLAIQVAGVQRTPVPCLVFDEVDAGVGGAVAEIVGKQLHALGERAQVLCVTHLPQVASQAHAHVRVVKMTDGRTTRTLLHKLDREQRVEEIARMLGGVEITEKAREHAAEMLTPAAGARKKTAKVARPAKSRASG